MLINIFKASGHSMEPIIKNESFFIASSIPLKISKLKKGDVILFKNENKNIVKKVSEIENDKIFVEGENKFDSKKFDPINKNEIVGKIIWIF